MPPCYPDEADFRPTMTMSDAAIRETELAPCDSLVATNRAGLAYLSLTIMLLITAIQLSSSTAGWTWLAGQMVFAFAFLECFVLLHEAGHLTLFRSRRLNLITGYAVAFFALIPFTAWRHIHARHHLWTGWQDKDATTASLVPRSLGAWERRAINFAWRSGLPLFSLIYRLQNYWNVWRLRRYLGTDVLRRVRIENCVFTSAYIGLASWVGFGTLLLLCGPGLLIALAIQDPLLLSQHTHMPQQLSGNARVKPFTALEQGAHTRSLRFPFWFSRLILHFDAHELHHMYVRVPGYHLRRINHQPPNEVHWWVWLRNAKRMSGVDFLFSNRDRTGVSW